MNARGSRRLFFALPIPAHVVKALDLTSQTLGRQVPAGQVRWVRPEGLHVTLRFLGDTASDQLPPLGDVLNGVVAQIAPFPLALTTLSCFRRRRPRVIWAGVDDASGRLQVLKQGLDQRLGTLGWPPERRRYHPHITLGRVRRPKGALALPWGQPLSGQSWQAKAVHLIESELHGRGPIYTVRHRAQLMGVAS